VAYFAALLVRTDKSWQAEELDLDPIEELDQLTELAREAAVDEDPVLILLEQEDTWFAVLRVDGEEDPRIHVSDAAAVARSAYADILLTVDVLGRHLDADVDDRLVDVPLDGDPETLAEDADAEDEDDDEPVPAEPAGDATLLDDFGVSPEALVELGGRGTLPAEALAVIAEQLGCADELEAVR
jgi:putative tRNA adenosine deaminase-associated protein